MSRLEGRPRHVRMASGQNAPSANVPLAEPVIISTRGRFRKEAVLTGNVV